MVVRPVRARLKVVNAIARADRVGAGPEGIDQTVIAQVGNLVDAQLVKPIPMTANCRIPSKSTNFDHVALAWCRVGNLD